MKVYTLFAVLLSLVPTLAMADSCTTDADCSGHGTCVESTGVCNCESGFITPTTGGAQCSYKQKSQNTAKWLQLFLGAFGAGEFYAGNYRLGARELLLTTGAGVALICGYALVFVAGLDRNAWAGLGAFILVPLGFGAAFLSFGTYVVEDLMFVLNLHTDGNGQPLKEPAKS